MLLLAGASASPAAAAVIQPGDGEGFVVSPVVIEVAAEPGETVGRSIRIRNLESATLRFTVSTMPTRPAKEMDGGLALDVDGGSAIDWLAVRPTAVRIGPRGAANVDVSVQVPPEAPAGAMHAGIVVELEPASDPTGGLTPAATVLVLVNVDSDARRNVEYHLDTGGGLDAGGPARWYLEVENTGEAYEAVRGSVAIDPLVGSTASVELDGRYVLPGQVRRFPVAAELARIPNLVEARWDPADGNSTDTVRVLVLPWWLAAAALLIAATWWAARRPGRGEPFESDLADD